MTMTIKDLQVFCNQDPSVSVLSVPFSDGLYTYAASSRVCIRVDRIAEVATNDHLGRLADKMGWDDSSVTKWHPAPLIWEIPEKDRKRCLRCAGLGVNAGCKECDGLLVVRYTYRAKDHTTYGNTADCPLCDGGRNESIGRSGSKCKHCDGLGFHDFHPIVSIESIGASLLGGSLRLICGLPNVVMGLGSPTGKTKVLPYVRFRFDGGKGLARQCLG